MTFPCVVAGGRVIVTETAPTDTHNIEQKFDLVQKFSLGISFAGVIIVMIYSSVGPRMSNQDDDDIMFCWA